ncbi:MAG: hypothetical protein IPG04_39005 [Polyangiaceae bacterium]|nr:hypothetical protein [Polyangiaceae bacterium]
MRPASTARRSLATRPRRHALGFAKGRDITEDDVHAVAQVVQARPAPTASDEWSEVARHRDRIEQWLRGDAEKRPLRLTKVHTLLVRDHDLQASYDTSVASR